MSEFTERLQAAARFVGVGERQAAIADNLGLHRQTVNRWFMGGEPNAEILLEISRRWNIDPKWLKSGAGTMLPVPSENGLTTEELDLIRNYRMAKPEARRMLRTIVKSVRKSIVMLTLAPLLLAPQDGSAAIYHNTNCVLDASIIHIVRAWYRAWLFLLRRMSCPAQTLTMAAAVVPL